MFECMLNMHLLTKCEIKMAQAWSVKAFIGFITWTKRKPFFTTKKVKDSY